MDHMETAQSPLETAAGAAGPRATDAFKRLGSETRLAILLALWEAYEPFGDDDAVPFSDLRDRVGVRDKGRLFYHLDRLVGHFVRRTDTGYQLRTAGRKIVRTVIAGTGLEEKTLEYTGIDRPCPHCGAPVGVAYHNGWLFQVCADCDGTFTDGDEFLPGTVTVWPFDQAGLADRTADELFVAGTVATIQQYGAMIAGVCPECSGRVETTLDVCPDHDPPAGTTCPTCERRYPIQARFVCTVCKNKMWGPPSVVFVVDPRVTAFYADRGVDLGYADADLATVTELLALLRDHDEATLLSRDPLRVRVTFRCEGASLRLTLDDSLGVVAVEERA